MSLLSSFIPGRFRLRSPLLSWSPTAAVIVGALQASEVVKTLEHKASTGSLLIHYDPMKLPLTKALKAQPLFDQLQALEKAPQNEALVAQVQHLCDQLTVLLS